MPSVRTCVAAGRERRTASAQVRVFVVGERQEGELFFGPTGIIWDERIVFSDDEGRVEQIIDQNPPL